MASKEAMDAARKYIGLVHDVDSFGEYQGTVVLGDEPPYFLGCDYTTQGLAEAGHQTTIEYLALILDHHTAALRREVEALRLRLLQAQAVLEPISEILGEPKLGYVGSADKIEHEARVYEAVNERLRTGLALLELSE